MAFPLPAEQSFSRFSHLVDTRIPDEGGGNSKSLSGMMVAAAADFIKQDVTHTNNNILGLISTNSSDGQTGESLTYKVSKWKREREKKKNLTLNTFI